MVQELSFISRLIVVSFQPFIASSLATIYGTENNCISHEDTYKLWFSITMSSL